MSDYQQETDWWQASDGKWYPAHTHPDYRAQFTPSATALTAEELPSPGVDLQAQLPRNEVWPVTYRGGWIGFFAGENQHRALDRALGELNARGLTVVAAVEDRWSAWRWIGVALVFLVTLGVVGKGPSLLLITEA